MRLSQRQQYHRPSVFGTSYFNIMKLIADFFSVTMLIIDRVRPGLKQELGYLVRSGSYISNYIMISYLLKYPLFTYKYNNPEVYAKLLQLSLSKAHKTTDGDKLLRELKVLSKNNPNISHQEHINKSFYKS